MPLAEPLQLTLKVAAILDQLNVPYVVGGSLASSLHGIPRATQDVDIIAALRREHERAFVEAVREGFYVSDEAVSDAIARRASFNIIHLESIFKVDIFVAKGDTWSQLEFSRAKRVQLPGSKRPLVVASAEDIVLHKLLWYEKGHHVSERQWRDVLGVLEVQDQLDFAYLRDWANRLGILDLFEQALHSSRST